LKRRSSLEEEEEEEETRIVFSISLSLGDKQFIESTNNTQLSMM
jgi:hypothetical protein